MAVDIWVVAIPGLVVGIIFGAILQRGRFCMNSAFRDVLLLREYKLIKSVFIAIFVAMIGFAVISFGPGYTLAPKHFMWGAQMIGGFVFGIGMVLAAGCASGTTYRVGEGMMGSLVALLGYAGGAYFTSAGALKPVREFLQQATRVTMPDGSPVTVAGEATPIVMLIVGIAGCVIAAYFWIFKELKANKKEGQPMLEFKDMGTKIFKKGWHWAPTGIAMGVLTWFAWISSAATGRNYSLGITGGWSSWTGYWATGNDASLNWEVFLVIGVVVGAFIVSMIAKEFKLRLPREGKTILVQFIGGLAMGFGAVMAAGCNIGNVLIGWPMLSVGSLVAGGFIVLGCWTTAYILFGRE